MCLGHSKEPSIEMVLLSTQNTCFGPETKKCEKIYLRSFQIESVLLQWQARILNIPLFGVVRQNFISVQLRECAGSSEPYLLQLCYIMRCPMWGEGKRIGERRIQFVLSSVQVVGLFITSGLWRLTSCLWMHDPTPCNLGNIVLLKYTVN